MAAYVHASLYESWLFKSEIAKIAKGIGMVATITGGTLGGVMMIRLGVNKAIWIFGPFTDGIHCWFQCSC